ncbi:YdcF family protein [Jeotgalicoccus sp. S0W5]|uniref:YdcF family protein n=1 Tax=Jeotgalicoccus sp. S0W5 TaxID=2527874 RepID=UPI001414F830|nr:YdcF family protein [Jeotgalicoccus sp. S0W5]
MKIRITVILICICLLLLFITILDSFNHSKTDTPKQADVIIMLGGGDGRLEKSAELYHKGYADYVMMSPEIESIRSQSTEYAIELGIPQSAIIEEKNARSTYTNATETLKLMEEYEFKSALIVSSDYHLKRTKLIYDRLDDGKFDLSYISALSDDGKTWHERPNAKRIWFTELYKLWGYRLGLYNFIDEPDKYDP